MVTKKTLTVPYKEITGDSGLNKEEVFTVAAALDAAQKAYSPYSKFSVGAAVLLENDDVVCGNNQENAAYPSGLCAERVALFAAGAKFGNIAPKMMTIVALKDGDITNMPVTPCGACRQVFIEVEKRYSKPFSLIMAGKEKVLKLDKASDLLPFAFNSIDI